MVVEVLKGERKMEKIPSKQISFMKINPRGDEEIYDGTIRWNNDVFYFKFENDFDNGNRYFVYDKNNATVSYFSILTTDDDFSEEDIYIGDIRI